MTTKSYRVVQWATGNIGTHALRSVIEHPNLTLSGVYVYTEDKAGRDAGDLCGQATTGVRATTDIDEILALGADCVLYMPRACDTDEVCAILASGTDIVTTRGEFHHPASMEPEVRDRVAAACAEGGTSIHSTGSSPGFITEALPLVLTSTQRQLTNLTIDEYGDVSQRDSPGMVFGIMGFGRPPAKFGEGRLTHAKTSFGPSLRLVAEALGLPLDDIQASGEVAVAKHDVTIAAGTVPAGTVAGQRITAAGMRNGKPLVRFRANWYCTVDLEPEWNMRDTGWHVSVDGDAPMEISIHFPVPVDRMTAVFPGYTANRAVNAIPYVCAAEPGIRTILDLPQFIATMI